MKEVSLIGCFRSGTNFTCTLLENNLSCRVLYDKWGWKHGLMTTFTDYSKSQYKAEPILQVVKNPYSTLYSWYNYVVSNGLNIEASTESFSSFLTSPIIFYDENSSAIAPKYYFSNPVQMWNAVTFNQQSFVEQMNGITVRYEDLLSEPESSLAIIAEYLEINLNKNKVVVPKFKTRNLNDNISKTELNDYLTRTKFDKSELC